MKKHPIRSTIMLDAAKGWLDLGVQVIPLPPGQKKARFKWETWLHGLDQTKLQTHWSQYPDDDLAILPGDQLVILDADTDEALAALKNLELKHGLKCDHYVKTKKGEHHYYRIPEGVQVRANSHSTDQYPNRIDVRTGRNQVVVAPSTNKRVIASVLRDIAKMSAVTQAFIDELMAHNGQVAHTGQGDEGTLGFTRSETNEQLDAYLRAMLSHLDPEEGGHDQWVRILMAVKSATHGMDYGLEIVDDWSKPGHTYAGRRALEGTWMSLRVDGGVTIGTIIWRLAQQGLDWVDVCSAAGPQFEVEDYEVIRHAPVEPQDDGAHPLKRYSITHRLDEIRAMAQNEKPALEPIALQGQATVIYAPPNTGKTLITLHMLIQSIRKGHLVGSQVFYLNCDDSADGLLLKGQIAQEYDFEMLSPGYSDFEINEFKNKMSEMAANGSAKGTVLIFDTLKKFVNVMDKVEASAFGMVCRGFCVKGGTIIALGHTNKHKSSDGFSIPGGTTDVMDDFDCAYVLDAQKANDPHKRLVTFRNRKRRGNVADSASFSYAPHLPYRDMLSSVRREDDFNADEITLEPATTPNVQQRILEAIEEAIGRGVNPQKLIIQEVVSNTRASQLKVKKVLEQHEGISWSFTKKDRGAKHYVLIEGKSSNTDDLDF